MIHRIPLIGALVVHLVTLGACRGSDLCGDGRVNGSEPCDGTDLAGRTCRSQGFLAGELRCDAECRLDVSGCTVDPCAAFGWYGDGERCDPCEALGGEPDPDCAELCGRSDGLCSPPTYYSLEVEGWTCAVAGFGDQDPDCPVCGNGVAEAPESCDGSDLPVARCEDLVDLAWGTGALGCTADCAYDLSECSP